MRIALPTLFFLLFLSFASCQATISCTPGPICEDSQIVQLSKRQELQAAKSWAKAEVPDSLKNWKIFQDGNRVREGIRKGYVGILRQVDKVREPYPEWKHVKKKWVYEPDLRKQYVLPRVLRLPAIMQETPIPHLKPFVKAVEGADDELGLKAVARTHVPNLSAELGKDGAKTSVEADIGAPPSKEVSPRTSARSRRRSRYSRRPSFNDFKTTLPTRDRALPRTPVPEIEPDEELPNEPADPVRGMPSINEAASRARPPVEPADTQAEQVPKLDRLHSVLVEMNDHFERIKKFKDEQIRKAASRYVGHPEHPLTAAADGKQNVSAEAIGLAPLRLKKEASQELSPDPTPRRLGDPTAMDADVSNPQTPHARTNPFHEADTAFDFTGPLRSPYTSMPDPSPVVSPAGTWTPKSDPLTPDSENSRGSSTPGSFRLPANYAETLHRARLHREQERLQNIKHVPSAPLENQVEPGSIARLSAGWEQDRPSYEGIRKVQEMAKLNDADYAIYNEDTAPEQFGKAQSAKFHPSDDEDANTSQAPTAKAKDSTIANEDWQSMQRDKKLLSTAQGRQKPIFDMSSFIDSSPRSEIEPQPSPSTGDSTGVHPANNGDGDNAGGAGEDEVSSTEARPRKRKRPARQDKPDQNNFNFPPPLPDLPSPRLQGFKPALTIKEAPNVNYDPASDAQDSPGVIFNRERLKRLWSVSSQHFRSFHERLKNMSPTASRDKVMEAYKELRQRPPQRRIDTVPSKDAISVR